MIYCFIKEELEQISERDPLCIQARYAKRIQKLCLCSLDKKIIVGQDGRERKVSGERILLRSSCEYMYEGIKIIRVAGGILIETESDIQQIEYWPELSLTRRPVMLCPFQDLTQKMCSEEGALFLSGVKHVFVKSSAKGFSSRISVQRLLRADEEVRCFLEKHCQKEDTLILSEWMDIKRDSLGCKESRHIVLNGEIINSSRLLHSIKHSVPQSQRYVAAEMVKQIAKKKVFPQNYVLDLGEFMKNGESFIDIVELNPLTPAMCYVNNSIFRDTIPEIHSVFQETGMGAEYCYDCMEHSEYYTKVRRSGENYNYINESQYSFI